MGYWRSRKNCKLWRHYYNNIDVVIFVIDSNDIGRLPEVKEELHQLLSEDQLRNSRVLIFSNKTDLPDSMNCGDIAKNRFKFLSNKHGIFNHVVL